MAGRRGKQRTSVFDRMLLQQRVVDNGIVVSTLQDDTGQIINVALDADRAAAEQRRADLSELYNISNVQDD